jgi:hypothetical protein
MRFSNFHLCIGVPCSFPFVPTSFFYSYVLMEKPNHTFIHADNGPIHALRNNIVKRALHEGATHLLMMDVDQIYHPQTIDRLLAHKLPLVGCLVHRRYPPFDSLMLKLEETAGPFNKYVPIEEWEEGSLQEVDATGAGCLLFEMQLFRDLDRKAQAEIDAFKKLGPTAEELASMAESTQAYIKGLEAMCAHPRRPGEWFRDDRKNVGEDIGFCQDVKAAGYSIFVDTSVMAGHLTNMVVNTATSRLYRSMKDREHKQALERALCDNKFTKKEEVK